MRVIPFYWFIFLVITDTGMERHFVSFSFGSDWKHSSFSNGDKLGNLNVVIEAGADCGYDTWLFFNV